MRGLSPGIRRTFHRTLIRTGLDAMLARGTLHAHPRSLMARLTPGHMLYPPPTIKTIRRHGILFELDISDYMEWCAYYGIETEARKALYALVRKGQVILDIGANVGETLLNLARIAGEEGRVYGFEVDPSTCRKCATNIALNPFRNVELSQIGLGRDETRLPMISPSPRNRGGARIASNPSPDAGQTVGITTVDRFLEEKGLSRVDLVKLDVEGFELNVLLGARRAIEKHAPTFFIELSDANLREQSQDPRQLLEFLEGFGYSVARAETGEAVRSSDDLDHVHCDVICRK